MQIDLNSVLNANAPETARLKALGERVANPAGGEEKLKEAARGFEQFMFGYMFKTMYQSVPKSGLMGDSFSRDIFTGLYIDEVMKSATLGDKGIAAMLVNRYARSAEATGEKAGLTEPMRLSRDHPTAHLDSEIRKELAVPLDVGAGAAKVLNDLATLTRDLEGRVSSDYGMRLHPIRKVEAFHHGIDYAVSQGTELKSPSAGVVVFARNRGGYGKTVVISHGEGVSSLYAHLSEITVKEGDLVSKNNVIGKTGSTGLSTGPHLHFEVRLDDKPIDPKRLVAGEKAEKTAKGSPACADKVSEAS